MIRWCPLKLMRKTLSHRDISGRILAVGTQSTAEMRKRLKVRKGKLVKTSSY